MTVLTEDNIIVTHLYSRLLTVLTEDIIVTHLYSRLLTILTEDTSVLQAIDSPYRGQHNSNAPVLFTVFTEDNIIVTHLYY